MSIIDDLEMSVRASNVLKKMGVETMDDFMALTRQTVMAQKNAGRRTWNEVLEMQTHFREAQRRSKDTAIRAGFWGEPSDTTRDFVTLESHLSETDDFRDRAALAALTGVMACSWARPSDTGEMTYAQWIAKEAWIIADAMCAARTKAEGET